MKGRTFMILVGGGMTALMIFVAVLAILMYIRSEERYRDAGCYDVTNRPIPQYYLDNGYYLKDGWVCPT